MNIKRIVKELIKKHNTNDPFHLCECLDIVLKFENLGSLLGYCDSHYRIRTIHINQNVPSTLQRFICAHELGHAILHHDINIPFLRAHTYYCTDKVEIQANMFAVELLLSDELIMDHRDTNLHNLARTVGLPIGLESLKEIERINFHEKNQI
jgi:Zn-dependent peptidase ImmA (M78 family)